MNDKFILYLGGGAMSGVYSAGVLKGIEELGLSDKIESIYAGSAGCFNAAYFLAGQTEMGASIYWENLIKNFIYPLNVVRGPIDLFINKFIHPLKPEQVHSVVDIDYFCRVVANEKKIDLAKAAKNPTNLFVKVLNTENGIVRYLKFQDMPELKLLKAAVNVKPYYFDQTFIGLESLIDATIKEPIGLDYLLKQYPDQKIVLVLNEPVVRTYRHYIKVLIEALVGSLYTYRISLFWMFLNREGQFRKEIVQALENPMILVVYPKFENRPRPRTTNPATLKNAYAKGTVAAIKIKDFVI